MNKKILYTILSLLFLLNIKTVWASEYDQSIIENIKNFTPNEQFDAKKDLSLKEDTLNIQKINSLPNQFVYNLKSINFAVQSAFSVNNTNKIKLYINESLKKVKEIEYSYKINDVLCTKNTITNYNKIKTSLYNKISETKENDTKKILESLILSEINQKIILDKIEKDYANNENIDNLISIEDKNIENLGIAIKKTNFDMTSLKQVIKKVISAQNENKSLLNNILINNFLETLKLKTNIQIKALIDEMIEENNIEIIKNINNVNTEKKNIDIEKNIENYLYTTYNNNALEQIKLIDTLYKLQEKVEGSKIKNGVKIAIINSKQIIISLLNSSLEKINIVNIDKELTGLLKGTDINKMNTLLLLKKYSDINGILVYKLDELEEIYKNSIINDLENSNNNSKEIKLKDYIEELSYENLDFIKSLTTILENESLEKKDIELKVIADRIDSIIGNVETLDGNKICSTYYSPVCGMDNATYNNSCFIEKIGINIKHSGECRIEENTKLKSITESDVKRGWYYGTKETKKPETPISWIFVEDGKYSKWIEPKNTINLK